MQVTASTKLYAHGKPVSSTRRAVLRTPNANAPTGTLHVDVVLPAAPRATRRARPLGAAARGPQPAAPYTLRCAFTIADLPGASTGKPDGLLAAAPAPEPLPLRNQLGLINQRIKPVLGNVARRGMRYGIVLGVVVCAALTVAAPIVGPFCAIAAAGLSAAVPVVLIACVIGGAIVEWVARSRRIKHVAVDDVRKLEEIYTHLQEVRRHEGKVPIEDREAWHKVNAMLEEMSGGFWRGVRLILADQFRVRMHCGRYQVGSIFEETLTPAREPAPAAEAEKVG